MPLTKENLETVSKLLIALSQRNNVIHNLAQTLTVGTVWRSPDGQLAVDLTQTEQNELEEFINAYLSESEVLIASIRAMLGQA
jgi:hypothetical protein